MPHAEENPEKKINESEAIKNSNTAISAAPNRPFTPTPPAYGSQQRMGHQTATASFSQSSTQQNIWEQHTAASVAAVKSLHNRLQHVAREGMDLKDLERRITEEQRVDNELKRAVRTSLDESKELGDQVLCLMDEVALLMQLVTTKQDQVATLSWSKEEEEEEEEEEED